MQADENTQINGKEFKAYLNNYSDLLAPRVKPKDRAQGREGGAALLTLEERLSRPWLAGGSCCNLFPASSSPTAVSQHWPVIVVGALNTAKSPSLAALCVACAGKVSSDVEAIFSTVMQSSWPLSLPIALTKAARQ